MKTCFSAIGLWVAASLAIAQTTTTVSPSLPVLKVSPATVQVRAGAKPTTQKFSAVETGVAHASTTFQWTLSGAAGPAGTLGTIDSTGVYTPPAVPPVPNTVTITATDRSQTPALANTATVTVLDPAPVITSLSPNYVNTALKYTVDLQGSGFMPSYKVMLDTTEVPYKFISSTDIQITGTSTAAAGAKIAVTVVDPATGGKTSNAATLTVDAPVAVTVSPTGRTIRCGTTLGLSWHVSNNSNQAVTWQVNGVPNGNASVGTITSAVANNVTTVTYTAPAILPTPLAAAAGAPAVTATPVVPVTITATAAADPTASGNLTVNLENATPVISSVTTPVNPGAVTLTINGTGFAPGATVYFASSPLSTTFVSATQLTATGTIGVPFGRLAAVKVTNPNPGTLTSAPKVVTVQLPGAQKMTYADAVRFLEMASWGPTPQSVADLQTMGRDAWLATQFAAPPSVWPDPFSDNEGMTRLQTAFFNIAINGQDQLRQRVSFALAQIMVSSGVKDMEFSQMVSYQRLLGNEAFGNFRTLLGDMTLNPAMGYYLDMVNNDKANPKKNTVANENYAREVMQLFTVGLVQMDKNGSPIPGAAPEYSQQTVTDMAKVFTGWTYSPAPGYASAWPNPPYQFLPMVPFDAHHDMTAKSISLPNQATSCMIPANGSALTDLNMALDCLYSQPTLAPFISYRLIQRLVKSSPSTGPGSYVARVTQRFIDTNGNLQDVVKAILTDPETMTEGTGKLAEPVLYATTLLRALNANVSDSGGINGQATAMGQNVMEPGSVFSYFSPFYRVSGVVAPEFQGLNAATSLARANFAWRAVTNGISGTVKVDLSNLVDLDAADPNQLVNAINQGLYRGEMSTEARAAILAAAKASTNPAANVRTALYAAAAAPQYQVQQ